LGLDYVILHFILFFSYNCFSILGFSFLLLSFLSSIYFFVSFFLLFQFGFDLFFVVVLFRS